MVVVERMKKMTLKKRHSMVEWGREDARIVVVVVDGVAVASVRPRHRGEER